MMGDLISSAKDYIDGLPFYVKAVAGTVASGIVAVVVLKKLRKKPRVVYPRDTVILHQPFYGPYQCVPFALKVETYLRITKVPYQLVFGGKTGPKGKNPWIEYNDQVIPDSSFIIKFINKTFSVDLDKGFRGEDLAVAHALQKMVEENTYWALMMNRYLYDKDKPIYKKFGIPSFMFLLFPYFEREFRKVVYNHGIGRHSEAEINEIMREDLAAVSKFLGKKKFLLGDQPCQADCAVFGQLAQAYWHSFGNTSEKMITEEFPNLCEYCDRMTTRFWPDWGELKAKHSYKIQF